MTRSFILRSFIALAAIAAGDAALAQSAASASVTARNSPRSIRAAGNQAAASAERQRAEIVRLVSYYKSIGCERGGLFGGGLFGGGAVPAECGSISQRIRQMEANYERLRAQIEDVGGSERAAGSSWPPSSRPATPAGSLCGPAQLLRVPLRSAEGAPPRGPDRSRRGHAGRGRGARRPPPRLRQDLRRLLRFP